MAIFIADFSYMLFFQSIFPNPPGRKKVLRLKADPVSADK